MNAKRRTRTQLEESFHKRWDFRTAILTEEDELWTEHLETERDCGERFYQGLLWLMNNSQNKKVLVVCHGGILKFGMDGHESISVMHDRIGDGIRFKNCELREYDMTWSTTLNDSISSSHEFRPHITLTEIIEK